ncbi:MAG: DNA primase, partial [Rhodospirillales bacterium]|nr:DNA primase [Rhodospirillales bacterium]
MAFSPQFLDELRARSPLSEVVGRRVRLIKKGREWHGLCPFHKEKTPSFTVNDEKAFYHCFGCGSHGSAFDFVMNTEGLSFPETVERLALDAGMEVPRDTPQERERAEKYQSQQDVTEAACTWFERALHMPEGKEALEYLRSRGIDDATMKQFRLGFAPNTRNGLKSALSGKNISEDMMVETGMLIRPPEDRGDRTPYDRFRGRVMFPIMDRRNRVIAFGGRIMGEGEPKYLNSPETPIFHKGQILYGLGQALPSARKTGHLIIAEGYMDVIALHMAGFTEAVAPLGTALTEEHLQLMWRVVREPVLCFDGDNAGQRASTRAAERALPLLKSGYGLRFAELPSGEDPDTLIKKQGAEAMKALLDAALPLSEVLWRMESGGAVPSSPEARAALQQRLGDHTKRIEDPTMRGHFTTSFKDRIWQGSHSGRKGGQGGHRTGRNTQSARMEISEPHIVTGQINAHRRQLEILLITLITHPGLYDDVSERLSCLNYAETSQMLDNLRQEVLKTLAAQSGLEFQDISDHLRNNGFTEALENLLGDQVLNDAYFARPKAELSEALTGWEHTFELMVNKNLDEEIRDAEKHLKENYTQENWDRLQLLQKQK